MEQVTSLNPPKLTSSTLDAKNNYYATLHEGQFKYFPIKIDESTLDLAIMKFERTPPVLIDGVVISKKKIYEVSASDILRGRICKSKEIKLERDNYGSAGINATQSSDDDSTETVVADGKPAVQSKDELRLSDIARMDFDQNADAAWQEQVESLLGFVSAKEGGEWEVKDVAQP